MDDLSKILEKLDEIRSEKEEVEELIYEEPTTGMDAIYAANYALSTLDMIDTEDESLTDTGKKAIARIKKRALKILDWGVGEIHDSIFDTE